MSGNMREFMKRRTSSPSPSPSNAGRAEQAAKKAPAAPEQPAKHEESPETVITYNCGHKVGVKYLQGTRCPGCVAERRREKARLRQEAEAKAPAAIERGRLPDGSRFDVTYSAETTSWTGSLTVSVGGEVRTFTATASAVKGLLWVLDEQYREWVRSPSSAGEASPESPPGA